MAVDATKCVLTPQEAISVHVMRDIVGTGVVVSLLHTITMQLTYSLTKKDIDECSDDTDNCDINANCTNTPGNFTCTCYQGYSGDGFDCYGQFYVSMLQ